MLKQIASRIDRWSNARATAKPTVDSAGQGERDEARGEGQQQG